MKKYNGINWKWRLADNGWADYICPCCGHANNRDIQCHPSYCEKCGWPYKDEEEPRSIEDVNTSKTEPYKDAVSRKAIEKLKRYREGREE